MPEPATVRERPVLFSGPMVKALIDGRKTQTRRMVKPQPEPDFRTVKQDGGGHWIWWSGPDRPGLGEFTRRAYPNGEGVRCPYGRAGERLWVKETFARRLDVDPKEEPEKARHYALCRADGTGLDEPHWHSYPHRWTPAIHMPRWASRLTLEITEVRVQRLGEISEEDAVAEGIRVRPGDDLSHGKVGYQGCYPGLYHMAAGDGLCCCSAVKPPRTDVRYGTRLSPPLCAFREIWDSINARRDYSWESNPWVWCIAFRVLPPSEGGSSHAPA